VNAQRYQQGRLFAAIAPRDMSIMSGREFNGAALTLAKQRCPEIFTFA
jgi:hypothetical protein